LIFARREEVDDRSEVRLTRVPISELGREELQESLTNLLPGVLYDDWNSHASADHREFAAISPGHRPPVRDS
jgi:hypothetical protein